MAVGALIKARAARGRNIRAYLMRCVGYSAREIAAHFSVSEGMAYFFITQGARHVIDRPLAYGPVEREYEIYDAHKAGRKFRQIGAMHGISAARAGQLYARGERCLRLAILHPKYHAKPAAYNRWVHFSIGDDDPVIDGASAE